MHQKIRSAGKNMGEAQKALIMLHGRGGSAEDILSLASHLNLKEYLLMHPRLLITPGIPYRFWPRLSRTNPGCLQHFH